MFTQDLIDICENLGWKVNEFPEDVVLKTYSVDFYNGKDIEIIASKKNFVQDIIDFAENYDAEEQAVNLYNNSDDSEDNDVEDYLEDAELAGGMVEELARTLSEAI